MKKKESGVLGVAIADGSIEAVLLRRDGDNVALVQRFVRQRVRTGDRISDLAAVIPGLKDSTDSDYTMEIGDGSSSASSGLFLASEFKNLGSESVAEKAVSSEGAVRRIAPFGLQLREILTECQKLGYVDPLIGFSIGSSEVTYTELSLPATDAKAGSVSTALSSAQKKQLIAKLREVTSSEPDKQRLAFVPMAASNEKRERFLAIAPASPDPVLAALKVVAKRDGGGKAFASVVDAEVSLYHSLARRDVLNRKGNVGIVRVGAEDTLIVFLRDGMIDRYERLRSLTSYDPADTICSRVLLKQDEWKIPSIDRIYISSDYHSEKGMSEYEDFFPEAETMPIVELLGSAHIKLPADDSKVRSSTLPAIGIALRVMEQWDKDDKTAVNLVSARQQKDLAGPKAKFAWHSFAMLALLFGVALFYTWRYMQRAEEIQLKQEEVRLNPPQFPTQSAAMLEARVDSLNKAYMKYTRALTVLDSLLIGSDRWSTGLDQMSRSTNAIGRIWLKGWSPEGREIRLEGNALSRSKVAALAERWNGSIEQLNFSDIGGIRVYSFLMMAPLPQKMPEVATYLRQQSIEEMEPDSAPQLVRLRDIERD
ncbi:MAG: hypothetical protein R2832_10710 [Rhodothermales bacterium]